MFGLFFNSFGNSMGFNNGSLLGALSQSLLVNTGNYIDHKLFGMANTSFSSGMRLNDLSVQTATYGKFIPQLFGKMKLRGNIIWSTPLQEVAHVEVHKNGPKGAHNKHVRTEYEYSVSIAIALCKGEINSVNRIWIDHLLIDPNNYNIRIYNGTDKQMPDPLIVKHMGGATPAFRDLAYVVFEDLQLGEFGNRIPAFSFEVERQPYVVDNTTNNIQSILISPGSGEFIYDTIPQYYKPNAKVDYKMAINCPTRNATTYAQTSLNNLQRSFPNLKWVSVAVSWVITGTDIARGQIMPAVDSKDKFTVPDTWRVAHYNRRDAHCIPRKDANTAMHDGTPNDKSFINFLKVLRAAGYKIMLQPQLVGDSMTGIPVLGNLNEQSIGNFFGQKNGYNNFIRHYAAMAKEHADAILLGNELQSLTAFCSATTNRFPAVDLLVNLAVEVRKIVGQNCKISYAAAWQEYHSTKGRWYNLDHLWACEAIDFVGINAFFPLSNVKDSIYDIESIRAGWYSGEGWEYEYTSAEKTHKINLSPQQAWKNIEYWWSNQHYNPDGTATTWQPQMKKIWFTGYGFPSVDCATNQPDALRHAASKRPTHSKGYSDLYAQEQAIIATELAWQNSMMVENKFLWSWDVRPFPDWFNVTNDAAGYVAWSLNNSIQGKLNKLDLKPIINEICQQCGIAPSNLQHYVDGSVEGFIINQMLSGKQVLSQLEQVYNIACRENNGKLEFIDRKPHYTHRVECDDLIPLSGHSNQTVGVDILRKQLFAIPARLLLNYIANNTEYSLSNCFAMRNEQTHIQQGCIDLPFVLSDSHAKQTANNIIDLMWKEREIFSFMVSFAHHNIKPGDVIELNYNGMLIKLLVLSMTIGINGVIKLESCRY